MLADIDSRLQILETIVEEMMQIVALTIDGYRQRLIARIKKISESVEIDNTQLE